MSGDPFDLDRPLLQFAPGDVWTIRDACAGVQIFGGIGSGKTTGSGAAIARAYLAHGFGGLVMTAKPEERELWERYADETGRQQDVVVFSPQHPYRFNFLEYEMRRTGPGGGVTANLVDLFSVIMQLVGGQQRQEAGEDFWAMAARQMLQNMLDVLAIAGEPITMKALMQVVAKAPQTAADMISPEDARARQQRGEAPVLTPWMQTSPTYQLFRRASRTALTPMQIADLEMAAHYWLEFWPTFNDRTRSSVVATFSSMADMLLHGYARELMATEINITPEVTWQDGMIIILDLSVQEYMQLGRLIQGIWKYAFQRAVLRRNVTQWPRPVFLFADESHHFVSPYDYLFLSTARSARVAPVTLTQNINNLRAVLGQGAQAQADALLGMSQTRIFHANPDVATNMWAAETIGQDWSMTSNFGANFGQQQGLNAGMTQGMHFRVNPIEFQRLRTGGPENQNQVDAIVFRGGRPWRSTGENYLRTVFQQ